jgi:hypothetical protein
VATNNDERGRPDIERFDELPPVIYDSRHQGWLIDQGIIPRDPRDPRHQLPRQRRHRRADEVETMRLVEECARLFQMTWFPSHKNEFLIYLPYHFVRPENGWLLLNKTTGEKYRVANVGVDATNELFTGSILLKHEKLDRNPLQAPYFGVGTRDRKSDRLEWVDEKGKVVEFVYEDPERTANELIKLLDTADEGGKTPSKFTPTVAMSLDRQEPGTTGKRPFDEPKQVRPHFREAVEDPIDPINYTVEIEGWWMDNLLRFDCFSVDSKEVNRLSRWFQNFMVYNRWVLELNGVQKILFWDRRSDQVPSRYRDRLPWRPVRYYARTEELYTTRRRNIAGINLTARTQARHGKPLVTGESTGVTAGQSQWDFFHDETGGYLGGTINIEESILPYEFL